MNTQLEEAPPLEQTSDTDSLKASFDTALKDVQKQNDSVAETEPKPTKPDPKVETSDSIPSEILTPKADKVQDEAKEELTVEFQDKGKGSARQSFEKLQ